jgi:syntaxin 1B/2/3
MPLRGGGGESETDNILDDCTAINETIDDLEGRLQELKRLQSQILSDRAPITQLDSSSANIMAAYRNLAARMKKIKSNPKSGAPMNAPQVGRVDRRLKSAMNDFQRIESEFRGQMRDQQARQYRIVNPNATEEEVREIVEDPSIQVFQQAVCGIQTFPIPPVHSLTKHISSSTPTARANPSQLSMLCEPVMLQSKTSNKQ